MGASLDMGRIAKELGRKVAEKYPREGIFQSPAAGRGGSGAFPRARGRGRPPDPSWSEQRLVRLSPKTPEQHEKRGEEAHASPMNVAALLLEQAVHSFVTQEQAGSTNG